MNAAIRECFNEYGVLSREEELQALLLYHYSADPDVVNEVKDKIIKSNFKLVRKCIRNHKKKTWTLTEDDLFQTGILGLIKALDKFDVHSGNRLCTFAVPWIRQAIVREIRQNDKTIRIPDYMWDQIAKIFRLDVYYHQDYERNLTYKELAEICNITTDALQVSSDAFKGSSMVAIDGCYGDEDDDSLINVLSYNTQSDLDESDEIDLIVTELNKEFNFSETQTNIIKLLLDEYTPKEICEELNLSTSEFANEMAEIRDEFGSAEVMRDYFKAQNTGLYH